MIKRLQFSIDIKADKVTIWKTLWGDKNYRDWAGIFFEGSYYVADNWDAGSTIYFLAPDKSGIYSVIEKHLPNELIEFRHVGNVMDGKEQPLDDETKKWSGATEIYKVLEEKGTNTLKVEIDVMNEHLEFMTNTFPKALKKVKTICES